MSTENRNVDIYAQSLIYFQAHLAQKGLGCIDYAVRLYFGQLDDRLAQFKERKINLKKTRKIAHKIRLNSITNWKSRKYRPLALSNGCGISMIKQSDLKQNAI